MGFFDKMKNMIGLEDQYYDEDYNDDYNDSYDSVDSQPSTDNDSYTAKASYESQKPASAFSNLVDMTSSSKVKISIQEPLEYEDGPAVIDAISQSKTVVLNLEMLEVDKKRQIFDFVNGGIYALGGSIQKVTKDIYVLVPKGVEIDAALKNSVSDKSLYQL